MATLEEVFDFTEEAISQNLQKWQYKDEQILLKALEMIREYRSKSTDAKEPTNQQEQADIQAITEVLDMWYSSDAQDHDYQEKNMECPTCALIRLRHVLMNKS